MDHHPERHSLLALGSPFRMGRRTLRQLDLRSGPWLAMGSGQRLVSGTCVVACDERRRRLGTADRDAREHADWPLSAAPVGVDLRAVESRDDDEQFLCRRTRIDVARSSRNVGFVGASTRRCHGTSLPRTTQRESLGSNPVPGPSGRERASCLARCRSRTDCEGPADHVGHDTFTDGFWTRDGWRALCLCAVHRWNSAGAWFAVPRQSSGSASAARDADRTIRTDSTCAIGRPRNLGTHTDSGSACAACASESGCGSCVACDSPDALRRVHVPTGVAR